MSSKRNEFIAQGSILAIASILVRIIGMIYRIPMTAIIGDEGNGLYSYAYSVYTILLLLSSYSLPLAVSKMISARTQKREWANVRRILLCAIAFALVSGGVFALLVLFGARFFTSVFFHTELAAIPLRMMAPTILIMALLGVFRGYFQGLQNTRPTALSQLLEQVVNAVVSVSCAWLLFGYGSSLDASFGNKGLSFAWGAAGGTIGTGAGALVALIFVFILYLFSRGQVMEMAESDKSGTKESYKNLFRLLFSIAVPVILSTALYNLIDLVDGSLFSHIMTARGLETTRDRIWGAYNAKALLLVHIPVSISSAMAVSLVPSLTAAYSAGKQRLSKQKVNATLSFTTAIAFPSAVGLFILARPIIATLFRGDNSMAWQYLMIASLAVITFSLSTITNSILQGVDRMNLPVLHSLIAMGVHVFVLLLLGYLMKMGIYGVIISYVIYGLVISLLNFRSIAQILKYRPDFAAIFLKPFIASAIMGLVCFGVYQLFHLFAGTAIPMLLAIVCSVATYFVVAVKIGLLTRDSMMDFPKGNLLVKLAVKLRLLKN